MRVKLLLAVMTATLGFASACPAQSQDLAPQIVGVWKYVSLNNKEVATGKMTYPLGEKPNGYIVYTKADELFLPLSETNVRNPQVLVLRTLNVLACSTRCLPVAGPTRSKVTRVW
jgi:hypothetical protein